MTEAGDPKAERRPISQRSRWWAKALTTALVKSGITPNQISMIGMVCAAFGGICFAYSGLNVGFARAALLLGGATGCQLRLLCNMMDGMVAVEGGKGARDGPIWNEAPDRFSDIVILVGAGCGAAFAGGADPSLGWAAAVFAVMTAYVREIGKSAGAPADFGGPMAKPHRMFVMTCAAVLSLFEGAWSLHLADWSAPFGSTRGAFLALGLWIVVLGAAFTTLRRVWGSLRFLRAKN